MTPITDIHGTALHIGVRVHLDLGPIHTEVTGRISDINHSSAVIEIDDDEEYELTETTHVEVLP